MLIRSSGALRLLQALLLGLSLSITAAIRAGAHEGHDHGAPQPAAAAVSNPRVTVQSEAYELVARCKGIASASTSTGSPPTSR
jgi:hypothetical protein